MKTLDQVEPRIPVESVPFTITEPGSYFLTGNLELASGARAITIASDNVTLDLMGFTISGGASQGIGMNPPGGTRYRNIVVRNGTIDGFTNGLRLDHSLHGHYEDLTVRNSSSTGVLITNSTGNVLRRCIIVENESTGITLLAGAGSEISDNLILDSVIADNATHGIRVAPSGDGVIAGQTIRRCTITGNGDTGILLEAAPGGDAVLRAHRFEDNLISDNGVRGIEFRARESKIQGVQVQGNTIHGHDNAGILFSSFTSASGGVHNVRIEKNTFSWNRFNGAIRSADSNLDMTGTEIRENVLADNAVGTASGHLQITHSEANILQGNHLSGESSHGLRTSNTEGQLVVQNTVFGEPLEISDDDRHGQIIESVPIQNSAWLNFRLE
ncbi:MAG: right-handed parallel beta-helix repeat-containing protein [Kiritimatiellae bacterium]|nr:right-handed parallel beta-helix repeat-containing protein [Kiritimatiellia bacterium]